LTTSQNNEGSKKESSSPHTPYYKEKEREISKEKESIDKSIPKKEENNLFPKSQTLGEKEKVAPKEKAPRRFVKPTVDEIRDYCEKRQNGIDAQYFYDYYEARGWKYGNTHIVDWKACVRTWERNGNRYDRRPASQPAARGQRTQRTGMADFKNVNAEYEGMRPLLESDFDEETLKELNKGIS
jgi:hypothetical protein